MGSLIDNLDLRNSAKVEAAEKRGADFIGETGTIHVGGYVVDDEKIRKLLGGRRYETLRELISDISIIGAGVRLFLNIVSKSNWQVEPAKDENGEPLPGAQDIADLVEDMMGDHKTAWHRIIRRVSMYRFYGFSIQERKAYRRDDGVIGMEDIQGRPQHTIIRWDLDEQGEVQGVYQRLKSGEEALIPRDKIIYAVDDSLTENPEGMGLLRHVIRSALRLKAFEELEEVGFENDLRGIPIAYGPLKEWADDVKNGLKTKAMYNAAKKPLEDFVKGHIISRKTGMVFDSEVYRGEGENRAPSATRKWAAELMRGDAQGFDEIANVIKRLTMEIAIVLGCEHLLLGSDGSGSLALSKTKLGTFYLTIMATMYELVEIMEDDWLKPIARLNGWDDDLLPSLMIEEVRDEDIESITSALANMAQAGAVLSPDDPVIAEVRAMLGLSPPPEDLDPDLVLGGGQREEPEVEPDPNAVGERDKPEEEVVKRRYIRRRK